MDLRASRLLGVGPWKSEWVPRSNCVQDLDSAGRTRREGNTRCNLICPEQSGNAQWRYGLPNLTPRTESILPYDVSDVTGRGSPSTQSISALGTSGARLRLYLDIAAGVSSVTLPTFFHASAS